MFLHPTYAPTSNDVYQTTAHLPANYPPAAVPAPACGCQQHTPTPMNYAPAPVAAPRPSIAPYVAAGIGAVGAVVVVGVVLVGLLVAFAVSALAIAVVIAVLRGLLNSPQRRGR
ncbi:SpdD protein [Streptacidiphilus sp. PAMC 29251]